MAMVVVLMVVMSLMTMVMVDESGDGGDVINGDG